MALTKDPVPRVVLLGRLSLLGERASRLHDQVLAVAGRWTDSTIRSEALKPYADATLDKTLQLLEQALSADDIDENSTRAFQSELEAYLRRQNSGLPIGRLQSVRFSTSSKERLVQLADLVAGAVRRSVEGHRVPLREIEPQMLNLQFWPPR